VGLISDVGPGPLALDTPVFIYFIQEDARFLPQIFPLFVEADLGQISKIFQEPTEQSFARSEDPAKESATSH
jgi:hypothetical protein